MQPVASVQAGSYMANDSVSLFISYSHQDEHWRERLAAHLAVMRREKLIDEWHDRKIIPGAEWNETIRSELNDADIILLLLSPDFLASDYCNDHEIPAAMALHEAGSAVVIPVHLRPCDWTSTPVAKLQGFPADARPVDSFASQDEALLSVAKGVRTVANRLIEKRRSGRKALDDARLRYRKKVEETLADGAISTGERDTLDELRVEAGLSIEDGRAIEAEALAPLRRLSEAQEGYQRTLLKILEQGWPVSEANQKDLRLRKRDLGLKDSDVEHIDLPLFAKAAAGLLARPTEATLPAALPAAAGRPADLVRGSPDPAAAPLRAATEPVGQTAVSARSLPRWLWAALAASAVIVAYMVIKPSADDTEATAASATPSDQSSPANEAAPDTGSAAPGPADAANAASAANR